MKKFAVLASVSPCALLLCALAVPAQAQVAPATLAKSVDIPYQEFTLKNGLRVIVHTDRKAPVVAVSVWYDVGSKHEPKGKTGFAHLFEHLMFNGSENAPGDFFGPMKEVGATDMNGTTYFDRTNYFETVPVSALDRTLFLESDRMGHLTGAITQAVLDEQRGVVQNEKRQGDNQPYGLSSYHQLDALFPAGHPYGHDTIGSMADLDAASLATVKGWFVDHYGPNNAVLVLAGDIDAAQARPLVEKYFGAIQAGAKSPRVTAPVPTLPAAVNETINDRVAEVRIERSWVVPGLSSDDAVALDVAAGVLGGLSSSRLKTALVREEKLASSVDASNSTFAQLGLFSVEMNVRQGVDPAAALKRLDAIVADFLRTGPTADEVQRYVARSVSGRISGLESVGGFGGKAVTLAEGALYENDPAHYKKELTTLAGETPASVKAAATRWLTRPAYTLTTVPGARAAYEEAQVPKAATVAPAPEPAPKNTRGPIPGIGAAAPLSFPAVQRTKLSNGIELVYAQRSAVPLTRAVVSFDAGVAADVPNKLGTQQLTLSMLQEGTTSKNSVQIAEATERLGATLGTGASLDRTFVSIAAPSPNVQPAFDLLADVTRHPAFAPAEVARVKNVQLARIGQELTNPSALGARVLPKMLYGAGNPYAKSFGSGDPKAVAALTRDDLVGWSQAWLRPEKAKIFVVSDRPLAEVKAALDRSFGDWRGTGAAGVKAANAASTPSAAKIVLIDRPDSPQSVILGGLPTGLNGSDELLAVNTANDALGGSFTGRLNMDLREDKHWSYGVYGIFQRSAGAAPYVISAPVQANRTGESVAALRSDMQAFTSTRPITDAEFQQTIAEATRSLPGDFETSSAVLQAMQTNDLYRRPDDYYATLAQKYRAMTKAELDAAARKALDPNKLFWVVVGDAKTVRPQLDSLGLPVEVIPAASVAGAN
ncbi:M16 family metallopeptidase [Sphingomonas aracearum]|uniref:Insulinase family protein n=1 Tax=Sphingomonas aracearum TaxID=2283317 RepID=A0A369VTN7_9SPHN|nr:pitrilysin family protein [Sphingomonas aracearum]RDE04907.1 insulinase family protein [Sphingomonas aracearum]